MLFNKIVFGLIIILAVLSPASFAQENEMMKNDKMTAVKINKNKDGVAIKGYDPVAYFTNSKAVMGDKKHSFNWMNAKWYFSSEENLNKFKKNPDMYAPQYGGYCAYGASSNYLVAIDPNAWTILDNKLYLNYNMSVSETFNEDPQKYIMKADKNWIDLGKAEDKMTGSN